MVKITLLMFIFAHYFSCLWFVVMEEQLAGLVIGYWRRRAGGEGGLTNECE